MPFALRILHFEDEPRNSELMEAVLRAGATACLTAPLDVMHLLAWLDERSMA
jgi:hypothetical protein